ncbi:NUDIX domain-containing protein [Tistrella bauzanensis]|uniref:NUDIX domain-containing protein n=1 Tax=Tistrella TaxID=171436 RepID=UPI0031F699C9
MTGTTQQDLPKPAAQPRMPGVGVIAIAWRRGRVALVLRANPPQAGHWGFPGGRVHWGEGLVAAAARELAEETGLLADQAESPAPRPVAVLEVAEGDGDVPDHHFVLVAVMLKAVSGVLRAGDDAADAVWADPDHLPDPLCRDVAALIAATRPGS